MKVKRTKDYRCNRRNRWREANKAREKGTPRFPWAPFRDYRRA